MALEISGNAEAYVDNYLDKYLGQLAAGEYPVAMVIKEMKRLVIAAATDDPSFYYIIGEGDPIISEDGRELGVDPERPDAHKPLPLEELEGIQKSKGMLDEALKKPLK